MAESVTITDNRTGESIEIPIVDGGVDSSQWKKLLGNTWFYDPAYTQTAATSSAITEIDGENGILRYRGYPIEELAEKSSYLEVAYLLIFGELPTEDQFAEWVHDITYHTFIHENVRKRFLEGFHHDAHPMGMLVSAIAALSTFYPNAKDIEDEDNRYRQTVRLIAKMPTLAAGLPPLQRRPAVRLPGQLPRLHGQLPLDDVEDRRAPLRRQLRPGPRPRHAVHPPRRPRAQLRHGHHADDRLVQLRPVLRRRRRRRRALRPPPRRGQRGRHQDAQPDRQHRQRRPRFVEDVKQGKGKLQGFGHRVYKNYDPRARIIKKTADEVFAVTGKNPLLDIALKLEEIALSDDYFKSRKLYPNVDFYSGLIYQAMGFPTEMFTVLFAIPRMSGWLAHWKELMEQDQKIARPRQLYVGAPERAYVEMGER